MREKRDTLVDNGEIVDLEEQIRLLIKEYETAEFKKVERKAKPLNTKDEMWERITKYVENICNYNSYK